MKRIEKTIVKAKNESDRSSGDAGDAVRQRHAEAVKCYYDHSRTYFL